MKRTCVGISALACWLLGTAGSASAGPIQWRYSSRGDSAAQFFLTGTPMTAVVTELGQSGYLIPFADFGPKAGHVNSDDHGRDLLARVTLTDGASGASGAFDVAYYFGSSESDVVNPFLSPFETKHLTLGDHSYRISAVPGDERLQVQVDNAAVSTPEPTSIALAGIGLAGAALARLRRSRMSAS